MHNKIESYLPEERLARFVLNVPLPFVAAVCQVSGREH